MKYLGVIMCAYVLCLLPFLTDSWYHGAVDALDYIDTPIYFVSLWYFFTCFGILTLSQRTSFMCAYVSVLYKWIDTYFIDATYLNYVIVNVLICGVTPLISYYYEKMDNRKFRA